MKARIVFLILSLFALASSTTLISAPTSLDISEIIHENAELGKVVEDKDGNNLITSKSVKESGKTLLSKLDKGGNFLYHNSKINLEYSTNAQITQTKTITGEDGYSLYYRLNGRERLAQFKDEGKDLINDVSFDSYNLIVSALTLKNEKVFLAGIKEPSADFAETTIDIKIFDPQAKSVLSSGQTLRANSKYISCAELKDNEVYCAYVREESILRSLLKIQHFKINENGVITSDEPILIKSFFTQFNSLKVIKLSQNKVGILFQTGDPKYSGQIPFGNTGKDLFFYELEVTPSTFSVLRYDFIFNNCRYKTEAEDYTIDIISPYDNTIYAICEVDNGGKDAVQFQLLKISEPGKAFEQTVLNKFGAKAIKNPSFVKMDNSLGILYTRIDTNGKKDVMLLMMNYPDCGEGSNLKIYSECKNQDKINSLKDYFKVFIRNPYPTHMSTTPLYYRIINTNGMKIYNGANEIELNKDYSVSTINSLNLKDFTSRTNSFIEYQVSRRDSDEIIFGRTCKINLSIPDCIKSCIGCDEGGTEKDNRCFDCKNGFYAKATKDDKTGCGKDGKLYDCNPCDIACELCYGPFNHTKPTTNCKPKKCNYEKSYFPFEKDNTVCINEKNKTYWEENLKCVLYFDKTKGDKPENWFWGCCHEHCGSCSKAGTDEQNNCDTCKKDKFYFYCNQTEENHGIPGNCHPTCEDDGCYKKEEGKHIKMCDCLPHCKKCFNNKTCEECRETWLLPPEKTSCDKECDYCLTPIWDDSKKKTNGRCINCKEYYTPEQYTYNNQCYTKENIPEFTYTEYRSENDFYKVIKKYHVYDKKCNKLTACKKGCLTCKDEKTDKCTLCEDEYYMEDPFNVTRPYFHCFTKNQCRGDEEYPHNYKLKVGGVDIFDEEHGLVCLNCKQRNESYRQPEPNYWCGPYKNLTFVEIPDYNKLTNCYFRCKTCDSREHGCLMECLSCRDSKYYDLIRYDKTHGNCLRKQHKCGIYPYYHNYELAINEDDCGEDCDVCLYNFQCPKQLPFFKFETHECVEFCGFPDVLGGSCNANTSIAILILLRNPFGLRHPYDFINNTVTLREIYESSLYQYFVRAYPELESYKSTINNYVGTGKVYNLPESKFIIGNNISIELSSVRLELEKIINYTKGIKPPSGGKPNEPEEEEEEEFIQNPSGIDLTECQTILKKKYNLPAEEDLLVVKSDILQEYNLSEYFGIETDYQLFSISLGAFLPLDACKEANVQAEVTNPFAGLDQLLKQFQSKTASVVSNGYDVFDANSPFYNDVCTPYTNENGNDVLLDARRKDYYDENINICESGCIFVGYNTKSLTYTCRCNIKSPGEDTGEYKGEIIEKKMPENFKDLISRRSNIAVFKCASNVFSAEGQKNNFGSYILLASFTAFIGVLVFHFLKEKNKAMDLIYKEIGNNANPPKGSDAQKKENKKDKPEKKEKKDKKEKKGKGKKQNPQKADYDEFINNGKPKVTNIEKDIAYSDYDLLFLPYDIVISKDILSYIQTYWNFLKFKQLILFTFVTEAKGILRSTKIALFILFVAFYMAFTALFFNDSIMRALYIYKGNANAAVHIPNIILSSICSFIASLIVRYVCLNERDISKILTEKNTDDRKILAQKVKKSSNIKLYILYAVSGVLILLCWYYVSAFCAIFKNSQKNYLINFLACFVVCNLWPFVTSIIPTIMRRKALENNNKCLYSASQIVSIF